MFPAFRKITGWLFMLALLVVLPADAQTEDGYQEALRQINEAARLGATDLTGNWLTALPPEIGQLANLIALDLTDNQLTDLPPEIGNLTNLITLILDGNPLPSDYPTALPDLLAYLREQGGSTASSPLARAAHPAHCVSQGKRLQSPNGCNQALTAAAETPGPPETAFLMGDRH